MITAQYRKQIVHIPGVKEFNKRHLFGDVESIVTDSSAL